MKVTIIAATILRMTRYLMKEKMVNDDPNAAEAVSVIRDAVYTLTRTLNITDKMWDNLHKVQGE